MAVSTVIRVVQSAFLQRQASATDTAIQLIAHPRHDVDTHLQVLAKPLTGARPVLLGRRKLCREFRQALADLDATEQKVLQAGFKTHNHGDYEPGRRFYFNDHDGVEYEIVSYA